ncbi:hypothetical protein RRG08_059645 [Elysia crispata]|uniref:Fibronectin type-III domain-containing protein n=1 Tax=Elysia crispata TaxID=231223 RepID=A0AAE1D9C0_9GAST|nr:hypothetical protein RRG08_059645 [Elysia crispata]
MFIALCQMFALLISEGKIEDSCNGNHTCHENLVCFQNETTNSSVCQCPSDSYKLNDTACTPKRKIGESCNVNETCHEGFECRDDTNNGSVCQCPSDYYEQNDTTCAPKRKIGESCNVNETCHEGLECRDDTNNGSVCQCPSDYYEQNDTTCAPKKRHGDSCNESLECISSLTCLEKVCRCQSKERFSGNSCYSVDDFQVTNITSTSTSDSVMLTWQTKKHGLSVDYSITIDPTPSADTTIPANFSGGTVDGLTPGTKYTFTIISTIKEDNVYPETTTNKTYEVVTKQQHAGFCNESVECISSLTCLGKVCRCQSEERFSGNSCYSVDDFQVTNITSTSTSDSVMLTWQTKKHGLSVDYSITIDPTPSADRTIPANFSGGTVDGLTSGTKYTFTIISTIKEDNVYPEMTTNKEYDVVTKQQHAGPCNESLECISSLTCLEKVCRCPSEERFSGNSCYRVDAFQVTNITSTSTSDSVMLTWQTKKHELSVAYNITIDPTPSADTTITANFSGGTVDGLTPGTNYKFTIISTIMGDDVYPETTTNKTYEVVTKPARPKGNGKEEKMGNGLYNFTFDGSDGLVDLYEVNIDGVLGLPVNTTSTWIHNVTLQPAARYSYTIVAIKGNQRSETINGTFQVGEEKPGKVTDLNRLNQTDTSVSVQWKAPSKPNGILTGYCIKYAIFETDDFQVIKVTCSDCHNGTNDANSACPAATPVSYKSQSFLNNNESVIEVVITGLFAYKNYTVSVQAVNLAGFGPEVEINTETEIGEAKELQNLTVGLVGTNITAGLNIVWEPGVKTGPTDYEVKIEEETEIDSRSYLTLLNFSLNGYSNNNYVVGDLLGFWNYNVSVRAFTKVGSSQFQSKLVKTHPTIPGEVTGFSVQLDPNDAQEFTLTFGCPEEEKRNGPLKEYVVRKTGPNGIFDEKTILHSSPTCTYESRNFGSDLIVEDYYTFQVKVANVKFSGSFNPGERLLIQPKGT